MVYHGGADGLGAYAVWAHSIDQVGARYGWSVGAAGDVNGDGYGDVIVGAPYHDVFQIDEGRAIVYYGNSGDGLHVLPGQWYAAPVIGISFSDDQIVQGTSPDWIDTSAGGAEISQLVTGLWPDTPYHWRVRLLYRPGNALGQPVSRWIHIPWAGWNETDLRTARRWYAYLPLVARNH